MKRRLTDYVHVDTFNKMSQSSLDAIAERDAAIAELVAAVEDLVFWVEEEFGSRETEKYNALVAKHKVMPNADL